MLHDTQLRWLLLEGLVPLFGAGLIFTLWGMMKRITHDATAPFCFAWQEAIDSSGWLYGALIIAIQSAVKSWPRIESAPGIGYGCIGAGILCLLLMLAAMDQRGRNAAWRPPRSMKIASFSIAVVVLLLGYAAQPADLVNAAPAPATGLNQAPQPARFESEK